jgi:hypothetical protein
MMTLQNVSRGQAENITLTEQFKNCNRKIVERGKFDTCTSSIHLHDRSLSWLATDKTNQCTDRFYERTSTLIS